MDGCYALRHSFGNCNNNLAIETLQIVGFKEIMIWNVQRLKTFAIVVMFVVINICNDW